VRDDISEPQQKEKMNYFAYGSNMNIQRMQQRDVYFSTRQKACLFGYCLSFNKSSSFSDGRGYANIVANPDGRVEGILYDITEQGIINLDGYEKYPHEYDRQQLVVRLKSGEEVTAHAYISQPNRICNDLRPTKEYLRHLLCAGDLLSTNYMSRLMSQMTVD